jgi:hypothetical protein
MRSRRLIALLEAEKRNVAGQTSVPEVAGIGFRDWPSDVCFGLRVQRVNATLFVVYLQGFQSPRSFAGVD